MVNRMKFQPPKGTRDLIGEDAVKMKTIIETARCVFEKYGFQPLFTPAFESFELLAAKGGLGEAVKDEIYYFKDKSDRELGLRFDQTMSLVRVVSNNPQLPKPFKRYVIDKVWRYDNPQAMRWREFWQADIDIIGTRSLLADAECLAATCEFLKSLGFKNFYIRINNRKLMQSIFGKFFSKERIAEVFRSIDKMDKIGLDGVKRELEEKKIPSEKVLEVIKISGSNEEILEKLEKKFEENEGLRELEELMGYAKIFGIEKFLKIDLSLVRGLEYYTGPVFEVYLGANVGCGGGGRYDKLIETVGGGDMPATGISLGLDRILEVMKENKIAIRKESASVFVANIGDVTKNAVKIAKELRENGISCQIDLMSRNLSKQLDYAAKSNFDYVVMVGKEEVKKGKFKLKDMASGAEKTMTVKQIIEFLDSKACREG